MAGGNSSFDHQLMMFRLNLWASKPYLQGVPHLGAMDNSAYLPNPMTSPALMVLASTADANRDATKCLPHSSHTFPADKDRIAPYTAPSFPMFRQGEQFPSSIYAQMSHFIRPDLGVPPGFLNAGNSSAFRPVLATKADADSYHSAFLPKKRKHEECASSSGAQMVAIDYSDHKNSARAATADERVESVGSCDTLSDSHSEADSMERSTPDEGRALRKQRRRFSADGHLPCCPVCGVTLRLGEVETHYEQEIEKLDKITRNSKKSHSPKNTSLNKKTSVSPVSGTEVPAIESTISSRHEAFLRVRNNRQNRLAARCKTRKKKGEESSCPVCNEKLFGSPEELNDHVEICLKQRTASDEDGPVDIEGEYEEYTWAGQTRIRATSLLPGGGLGGTGFGAGNKKELDEDVVVDGEDSNEYGPSQFTEADVIPCVDEDMEGTPLREAILQCESSSTTVNDSETRLDENTEVSTTGDEEERVATADSSLSVGVGEAAGRIIESLKARLKSQHKSDRNKCLICMESYHAPLTSIQCWHVYCRQCWLRTLGAKKLCPQCNMITSPSDLRVIYL